MSSYNLDIRAVLEKELYTTPPLMPVVVAKIVGTKRDIPRAFRLTKDVSTGDMKHLRRIRNLADGQIECILRSSKATNDTEAAAELDELTQRFSAENIFKDYRVAQVPSTAPKTDHQLRACSDIWPCKFARSQYLIQCIEGSLFNPAERLVLRIVVNNILDYIKTNEVGVKSAAVVFRCAKIYGIGLSNSETVSKNPIKHSPMISIDSVATNAGAGHWRAKDDDDLVELMQKQLDEQEELTDHRIDAHFLPYLCTNYDIFVTEEPCFMCTMGLVQSRIRRLFYLDAESLAKLTSCQQLCYADKAIENFLVHRERNLNHRFEAWRIVLIPEK